MRLPQVSSTAMAYDPMLDLHLLWPHDNPPPCRPSATKPLAINPKAQNSESIGPLASEHVDISNVEKLAPQAQAAIQNTTNSAATISYAATVHRPIVTQFAPVPNIKLPYRKGAEDQDDKDRVWAMGVCTLKPGDTCVFISIMYEKLPEFCASCSSVGHNVSNCRWNKGPTKTDTAGIVDPIIKPDPKENPKVRQEYRVKDCLTRIINDVQGHHVDQDAEEAVEITFAADQTIPNIEEAVNDQLVTANPMQVVVEANDAIPVVSMHTFGTLVEVNNPLASRGAMEINFDASVVVLDNEIFDQLSTEEDIVDKLAENDDFSLTIREIAASEAVNMVSGQAGIEAEWTAVKNRKKRQGKKSPYSEPWVSFADIPRAFWRTLKLQLVCTNHRIGKQPNLWVLASTFTVNVQNVSITSQQVTLTVNLDQNLHKISFVYANSTSYIMRRDLLNDLWVVHSSNSTTWLVLGNFNVVLGAHEKTGKPPPIISCQNFSEMMSDCELHCLDTRGPFYT
ncbi:hypothetical protein Q3G72_010563 [Acer saccharum]|nr:hypothetical protein Q3G72_010563 [Acer saccharum]